MSRSFTPQEKELQQRVGEVLHYLWDPLSVSDTPEARDEYDSYAPHVFSLLLRRVPIDEIAKFLYQTEIGPMGLSASEGALDRAKRIAELLESYRDWIDEMHAKRLTNRSS